LKLRDCYNCGVGRPSLYQPVVSVLPEIDLCERADAAQSARKFKSFGGFQSWWVCRILVFDGFPSYFPFALWLRCQAAQVCRRSLHRRLALSL
jgi:hypothetical protein